MKKNVFFAVPTLFLKLTILISELYSTLCYVEGDLSQVPKPGQYSDHLRCLFYEVRFDVILSLGLTEFKAFIAWTENVRSIFLSFPIIMNVVFTNIGQREKVRWLICSLSILLIHVPFIQESSPDGV